jgi:hypothetical protein
MAELKTKPNSGNVEAFLESVDDEKKKADSIEILSIMKEVTGEEPKMWGDSIVGFGSYHYKYASGREGDWFIAGFSPRKQNITLYLMCDISILEDQLQVLGKYKTGKSCLYIKKLEDVDREVLKEMIRKTMRSQK